MPRKIRMPSRVFTPITNNTLSYIMVTFANFCWVSGFIYPNEQGMSFFQSQLSRYICQALITYALCKYMGLELSFQSNQEFVVLGVRSLIFTLHSFVLGWSQFYLPLYVVHTISAFGPIFVCILNYFVYKKHINKDQIIGMIIAFGGILLTVNGRSIYHKLDPAFQFNTDFHNYLSEDVGVRLLVSMVLLLFVLFWAYAIIITKRNQHHIVQVVYHQAIFGIIGSALGCNFLEKHSSLSVVLGSYLYTGIVLGGGFVIFNTGLALTENTGLCSLLTQMNVVIGYGYSIFRYEEPVNPICILGAVLLIGGVAMVLLKKDPK